MIYTPEKSYVPRMALVGLVAAGMNFGISLSKNHAIAAVAHFVCIVLCWKWACAADPKLYLPKIIDCTKVELIPCSLIRFSRYLTRSGVFR